jgi:tetratricopeptide (TPR) repeat protein
VKIACLAISLNEAQFCARWADSCKLADYCIVADTGSTDDTVRHLLADRVTVHKISVKPWRFDVARNAALALVPADADICITLDMDEILMPGWRAAIEAVWRPYVTRLRYNYVWNWNADGTPGIRFRADRCYARAGYIWRHPVHETVYPQHGTAEVYAESEMTIHHHADDAKPRAQYLPLLELAVHEDPKSDRMVFYLGREYALRGRPSDAVAMLETYLEKFPNAWGEERAAAMRLLSTVDLRGPGGAEHWLRRACKEYPDIRQNWYELAVHCMNTKQWAAGAGAAHEAMDRSPSNSYMADGIANTYGPFDVGSICAFYAGVHTFAKEWWSRAAAMAPNDERIKANGVFINGESK